VKLDVVRPTMGDAVRDPLEDLGLVSARQMVPAELAQSGPSRVANRLMKCTRQPSEVSRTLTPGPSPFPSHPPSQGEGNPRPLAIQAFLFAFLPLLPVREGGRGREKRAGVMRANAEAKVNLTE
jgi:hypothetical protein